MHSQPACLGRVPGGLPHLAKIITLHSTAGHSKPQPRIIVNLPLAQGKFPSLPHLAKIIHCIYSTAGHSGQPRIIVNLSQPGDLISLLVLVSPGAYTMSQWLYSVLKF